MQYEDREQAALAKPTDIYRVVANAYLKWAENPKLHGSPHPDKH